MGLGQFCGQWDNLGLCGALALLGLIDKVLKYQHLK
jgi:hypothetical protein